MEVIYQFQMMENQFWHNLIINPLKKLLLKDIILFIASHGQKVSLQTCYGTFLSAWNDGNIYQQTHCKEWEIFTLEHVFGGKVAFKTHHGTYLSAHQNSSIHQANHCKEWEHFEIHFDFKGCIGLRTHHGGFLSISNDGKSVLAQSYYKSSEEIIIKKHDPFVLLHGDKVSIQTCYGTYLSAWNDGNVYQQNHCKEWEIFTVEHVFGGKVAFKTHHGTYLSAHQNSSFHQANHCKEWEHFEIHYDSKGCIGLKTHHGGYLSVSNDGKSFLAQLFYKSSEEFIIKKH